MQGKTQKSIFRAKRPLDAWGGGRGEGGGVLQVDNLRSRGTVS